MTRINWTVDVGATSFTSITQSLSFNFGRPSYFSTPTGGTCTFTVRNNTGQAQNINQGDLITIGNQLSLVDLYFYVVDVTFQDQIATAGNTATITGVDAIGQISQFPISGEPGIYNNALDQIAAIMDELAPFNPPYPDPSPVPGRAIVEDAFDQTTIGQRIIELLLTENSSYYFDGNTIVYRPSGAPSNVQFTIGLSSATSIVYDNITRKYPNANYPNTVNLTSTTVGTTTQSVTGTYRRNYDRRVLFNTAAQQQAQTDYYANVLSVEDLYADIQFNDNSNIDTQITYVLDDIPSMFGKSVQATYNDPNGGTITNRFVIEGGYVSAVPGQTNFTLYLSPTVIYDLFTLDSSTFGVLGGTMVYDTAITYDDEGETYDASTTDNGNRLGW